MSLQSNHLWCKAIRRPRKWSTSRWIRENNLKHFRKYRKLESHRWLFSCVCIDILQQKECTSGLAGPIDLSYNDIDWSSFREVNPKSFIIAEYWITSSDPFETTDVSSEKCGRLWNSSWCFIFCVTLSQETWLSSPLCRTIWALPRTLSRPDRLSIWPSRRLAGDILDIWTWLFCICSIPRIEIVWMLRRARPAPWRSTTTRAPDRKLVTRLCPLVNGLVYTVGLFSFQPLRYLMEQMHRTIPVFWDP